MAWMEVDRITCSAVSALGQKRDTLPDGQINFASTKPKSSPSVKNILIFRNGKSVYISRHPALTRGALRGRHGRWVRDAMDADGAADEST
jgi:hypothetical protein